MYLYQYAVTYTPLTDGGDEWNDDAARVLIPPTTMLANNPQTVERVAIRAVNDDGTLDWDHLNVIVTPFGNGR